MFVCCKHRLHAYNFPPTMLSFCLLNHFNPLSFMLVARYSGYCAPIMNLLLQQNWLYNLYPLFFILWYLINNLVCVPILGWLEKHTAILLQLRSVWNASGTKNSQFVCQKTKPWCHTAGCLPPFRSQVSANLSQSFSTAPQSRLALEAPSFGSMFTAPHSSGMISSNAVNALFNCTAQRGHHFMRFNWTRCYTIPAFHCWPRFFPDPC